MHEFESNAVKIAHSAGVFSVFTSYRTGIGSRHLFISPQASSDFESKMVFT